MKNWLLLLLLFSGCNVWSQDSTNVSSALADYKKRQWIIGGLTAAGYGGSFAFLSTAWYKDYPKTGFHTFNDAGEWQQIDKSGHAWTAYHTSRITTDFWRWAGVSDNKALWLGTSSSMLYMLSIEYLDGHSAEWGWSWADVGANLLGASLFASQEGVWKEQRVSLKFSTSLKTYEQDDLQQRADQLFGSSFQGRLLKDYNAQTYWLSANLRSFLPQSNLPAWLNVAVGYGAENMFGGYENIARDKNGNLTFNRRDIKRYRQWYVAPDVDFTKIKTNSKVLRTLFSAVNLLKFPAPALELSAGRLQIKAIAY
ncbi:MAG: YfiM family protein [Bacteroidota bacterium]|nr:YfiM family protein [Bacteroidota bacterium]